MFLLLCLAADSPGQPVTKNARRGTTVTDAIEMTRLGLDVNTLSASDTYLHDSGLIAHFSPDRRLFFVVLRRGDIERNLNTYSLYVYRTAVALSSALPKPLLTLSSGSNEPAIKGPKWLDDNATITFISQSGDDVPQVYAFNISSHRLERLTNHATAVRDYDVSGDGSTVMFEADFPSVQRVDENRIRKRGVLVTSQALTELLRGHYGPSALPWTKELFAQVNRRPSWPISPRGEIQGGVPISVSPDGHYAIFSAFVWDIPPFWADYEDRLLHPYVTATRRPGEASRVCEYFIVDLRQKMTRPLLGTPWSFNGNDEFVWAPDGRSVVVSGARLPLNSTDDAEQRARRTHSYIVEISLQNLAFNKITDRPLRVLRWSRRTNKLLLRSGWRSDSSVVSFEKGTSGWKETETKPDDIEHPVEVSLKEDMNSPPKLYVSDPATKKNVLLVDLNPQFNSLKFGREEAVTWKASDGHEVSGGLYLPTDYVPGRRYPLVIQTHGFSPEKFWIDGPWSSAFAAQPLANKAFVVLQVGHAPNPKDDEKYLDTPQEGPRQMAAYEGAIDYLDKRGLIDREAVGIIGFSRTVYYVAFTLTHSKYQFAAATIADGVDGGYFLYRAFPGLAPDFDSINGGPPVGPTLAAWVEHAPNFNLDKVTAPVRIEDYGPESLFLGWEWFVGLSALGKPVEFVYLPEGTHMLEKPWERLVSQQGNVDWFTFWLKNEADPDPAKAAQYKRWRKLRELHEADLKSMHDKEPAAAPTKP